MYSGSQSAPGNGVGRMTPVQYVLPWTNSITSHTGSVISLPGTAQYMVTDNNNIKSNSTAAVAASVSLVTWKSFIRVYQGYPSMPDGDRQNYY